MSITWLAFPCSVTYAETGITYTVSIKGVNDRDLQILIETVSNTVLMKKNPPVSVNQLKKRIDNDISNILKVLRSVGFYSAHFNYEINADQTPAIVNFLIDTGEPYLLNKVEIQVYDDASVFKDKLPSPDDLGLTLFSPARSNLILEGQEKLERWFKSKGYPFAKIKYPTVTVDHSKHTVSVVYSINSGSVGKFGITKIEGLEFIDEAFVLKKLPWKVGDRFDENLLEETKKRLYETDLFSSVNIEISEIPDISKAIITYIKVRERSRRTFKTGVNYRTDEGAGAGLSWENRNLSGMGEYVDISGLVSEISYSLEGNFRKPYFFHKDRSLALNLRIAKDHPEAYESSNITSIAQIEQSFKKRVLLAGGIGLRRSKIDQLGDRDRFNLLSVPISMDWDRRNDILDPVRGGRLNINLTPYYDTFASNLGFIKGYMRYSHYFKLSSKPFFLLAVRGMLGTITGADQEEIPADLRFYTGGGGSIRGYAFQTVGPIENDKPLGGRSIIGLTSEIRTKLTDSYGLVFFIDGGNVSRNDTPDFGETFRWGAGIGFRYYTPIGPLRMDIGFPLNRRENMDDSFQVYLSLGQAF